VFFEKKQVWTQDFLAVGIQGGDAKVRDAVKERLKREDNLKKGRREGKGGKESEMSKITIKDNLRAVAFLTLLKGIFEGKHNKTMKKLLHLDPDKNEFEITFTVNLIKNDIIWLQMLDKKIIKEVLSEMKRMYEKGE